MTSQYPKVPPTLSKDITFTEPSLDVSEVLATRPLKIVFLSFNLQNINQKKTTHAYINIQRQTLHAKDKSLYDTKFPSPKSLNPEITAFPGMDSPRFVSPPFCCLHCLYVCVLRISNSQTLFVKLFVLTDRKDTFDTKGNKTYKNKKQTQTLLFVNVWFHKTSNILRLCDICIN